MGWKAWLARRWARGIVKAQLRTYEKCRDELPDAPEKVVLKAVLSARLGYSHRDVERMAYDCNHIGDLCFWVVFEEASRTGVEQWWQDDASVRMAVISTVIETMQSYCSSRPGWTVPDDSWPLR